MRVMDMCAPLLGVVKDSRWEDMGMVMAAMVRLMAVPGHARVLRYDDGTGGMQQRKMECWLTVMLVM